MMAKTTKRTARKAPPKPAKGKGPAKRGKVAAPAKTPPAVKYAPANRQSVTTDEKQPENPKPWLFQPGQSGNPKGRPKGSKHVLQEDFLGALVEDFKVHGIAAIVTVREEKPADYLRVIASCLPKDVNVEVSQYDTMTDDQLKSQIKAAWREAMELGVDLGALGEDAASNHPGSGGGYDGARKH